MVGRKSNHEYRVGVAQVCRDCGPVNRFPAGVTQSDPQGLERVAEVRDIINYRSMSVMGGDETLRPGGLCACLDHMFWAWGHIEDCNTERGRCYEEAYANECKQP